MSICATNRLRPLIAFGLALLGCILLIAPVYAHEAEPRFVRVPEGAPNPPAVTISRSGSHAVRLDWLHPDPNLIRYEVWRGEAPYFDPGRGAGASIGSYAFSAGVYGEGALFAYTDDGACGRFVAAGQELPCAPQNPPATVVGDPARQHYWLVRASNGELADSNRVGAFDFALVNGL